jgi:hypothetical protein
MKKLDFSKDSSLIKQDNRGHICITAGDATDCRKS